MKNYGSDRRSRIGKLGPPLWNPSWIKNNHHGSIMMMMRGENHPAPKTSEQYFGDFVNCKKCNKITTYAKPEIAIIFLFARFAKQMICGRFTLVGPLSSVFKGCSKNTGCAKEIFALIISVIFMCLFCI